MATQAKTLSELAQIRAANFDLLDGIHGQRGTALGFKNRGSEPAILVFVERKVGERWLPPGQIVPKTLFDGPGGLECPTDVIAGESERDLRVRVLDSAGNDWGDRPLGELVDTEPLSPANLDLVDDLRGGSAKLTPGCQLAYLDEEDRPREGGTLACFAQDLETGELGLLTNQHIGWADGNRLWFPGVDSRLVGRVERQVLELSTAKRYEPSSWANLAAASGWSTVDAAFCLLAKGVEPDVDVDFRLPTLEFVPAKESKKRVEQRVDRQLGQPLPFDPDTSMGPVGKAVIGVGRTRGFQQGVIEAFAYEHLAAGQVRRFVDYLIVGEGDGVFSAPGNSGTLIVTSEGLRPVAIMWAGQWARRRPGRGLQDWTHATEINFVLKKLNIAIRSQ
jgi:hypothetical protein